MTTLTPEDLRKRLVTEILKIDGDVRLLPEINNSNDDAYPFIEIDRYGYNYICRERGNEIFRKIPYDIDELVYEVFKDVVRRMTMDWKSENRNGKEDFRRQRFEREIELMTKINHEFADRLRGEINQILKYAPYKD